MADPECNASVHLRFQGHPPTLAAVHAGPPAAALKPVPGSPTPPPPPAQSPLDRAGARGQEGMAPDNCSLGTEGSRLFALCRPEPGGRHLGPKSQLVCPVQGILIIIDVGFVIS